MDTSSLRSFLAPLTPGSVTSGKTSRRLPLDDGSTVTGTVKVHAVDLDTVAVLTVFSSQKAGILSAKAANGNSTSLAVSGRELANLFGADVSTEAPEPVAQVNRIAQLVADNGRS